MLVIWLVVSKFGCLEPILTQCGSFEALAEKDNQRNTWTEFDPQFISFVKFPLVCAEVIEILSLKIWGDQLPNYLKIGGFDGEDLFHYACLL